jgi:hypothetical protein
LIGLSHEEQPEDHESAQDVAGDHHPRPIHPVDDDAGERADSAMGRNLHDQHPRDGGGRTGEIEQQRVDRHRVEPVSELRDGLAEEDEPKIPVGSEKGEVNVHNPAEGL